MAETARDLLRSSGPTSLLKQSQLQPRTVSRWLLNISKDADSHLLSLSLTVPSLLIRFSHSEENMHAIIYGCTCVCAHMCASPALLIL